MDDLIGEFVNETSESLAALERALADHARSPMDRASWNTAATLMHTIEGTCGFLQLPTMARVAAASEDMLEKLRDGTLQPGEGELAQLRAAMAQIRYMMDHLAVHGVEPAMPKVEPKKIETPAAAPLAQLNEQVHRVPEVMPPLPTSSQPVARVPEPVPGGERVSYATLATLMLARNQLKHLVHAQGDRRVLSTQHLLDTLIHDLRGKLLPRTAPERAYPHVAKVLMVESGGMRFALAQEHIREVARIGVEQRHARLDDGAMIALRGGWVPRISLAARLGQGSSEHEAYALVVEINHERIALCVETIGELEELMLQPVPKLLRSTQIYESAAILGDGTPCLVLDSAALLRRPIAAPASLAEFIIDAPIERVVTEPAPQPEHVAPPVTDIHVPAAYLLFGDGTPTPKAIPLSQVGRVEHIQTSDVKFEPDGFATKCRGEVLKLKVLPGSTMPASGDLHAITLLEAPHIGIVAHRMNGIIESDAPMPAKPATPSVLMLTELDGALTEIIHAPAYMQSEARHD